jgi:quaternary ammonium compound-resistance protein SugE
METVWAVALDRSAGFSRPIPIVTFLVSLALSMAGLAYALRTVPVGAGYVVWVGIGAVGTALVGIVALGEPATLPRLSCLLLVVAGVVGLKVFH